MDVVATSLVKQELQSSIDLKLLVLKLKELFPNVQCKVAVSVYYHSAES